MTRPELRIGGVERGPFAAIVIAGGPPLVLLSAHTPLWVVALVCSTLLVLVTVRVAGRTGMRRLLDRIAYRAGYAARAAARAAPLPVTDVAVPAGVCGIGGRDGVLVAMIQLAPNLDLPTVVTEATLYTEDTIGIGELYPMLDQFGVGVDIDVVTTGRRVRADGGYSMLYDQLIGTHPVVGDRRTWLVVRLDQRRNLVALARRGAVEVTGPQALATAAHRIANRLRERGIAAHALPAGALREAARSLHAGVELDELRETWRQLESSVPGRSVTSFAIDWPRLGETGLDDCWSWSRGHTTLVIGLSAAAAGPRALVRYVGPPVSASVPEYLRPLGGAQSAALLASLPGVLAVGDLRAAESGADIAPAELVARLALPIGPNGQILGAISGQPRHSLALPLFDPARYNPRRRAVDVHAVLPVAQQIVLRAMVVGADIEVHTARPQHWQQLVAAVGDDRSLRLVDAYAAEPDARPEPPATIAVFDQLPPRGSEAPTTVTINEPGGPRQRSADLAITQVSATAVDVSIPMRTVRVELIEPRGETRYVDPADGPRTPSAPAGSTVHRASPPTGGLRVS